MFRVHPDFVRAYEKSGISHHMFFNKQLLTEMFEKVEKLQVVKFEDKKDKNVIENKKRKIFKKRKFRKKFRRISSAV